MEEYEIRVLDLEGILGVKNYCSEHNVDVLTLDGDDLLCVIAERLGSSSILLEGKDLGPCEITVVIRTRFESLKCETFFCGSCQTTGLKKEDFPEEEGKKKLRDVVCPVCKKKEIREWG